MKKEKVKQRLFYEWRRKRRKKKVEETKLKVYEKTETHYLILKWPK